MIEFEDWEFPEGSRPRDEDVAFDLDGALASVVSLRTEIPDDAYTASILGTERGGNGVVISDTGLVLTIGYLITEATDIAIGGPDGGEIPAQVVGYDHRTGLGLVRTVEPIRQLTNGLNICYIIGSVTNGTNVGSIGSVTYVEW